jgi:hypothetical protein
MSQAVKAGACGASTESACCVCACAGIMQLLKAEEDAPMAADQEAGGADAGAAAAGGGAAEGGAAEGGDGAAPMET